MEIKPITAPEFRQYGRIVDEFNWSPVFNVLGEYPCPTGVFYCPSAAELEALPLVREIERIFYGEMPMQSGYCSGHNVYLNGLEYHRSSEINAAATDAILFLGRVSDITSDYLYNTNLVETFLLPAGSAVELYATTLHYAPCSTDPDGFKVGIFLPKGTNLPLHTSHGITAEDKLLFAANKWLLAHPDGGCDLGAHIGLTGKNLRVSNL